MPPAFDQVMKISTMSINQVFAGQSGDGPLQVLQYGHGQYQSTFNTGLLMLPGEQLTLQLANPGSYTLNLEMFEFAPYP